MVILCIGIIRCDVYQKMGCLFVPFVFFNHLSKMRTGKGQKDCKPYTASLSHSAHLEHKSCGSHFEMPELPQHKYSYVCIY
jgi:hypothetical protein